MNTPRETRQDALRSIHFQEMQTHYPDQKVVNDCLMEELQLQQGETWLEVGSGSGALCRQAAAHLLPAGRIIGLDLSPVYLQQAFQYARDETKLDGIHFLAGDGMALPFRTGSFNGAYAARLMLNVRDPDAILQEMVRVIRKNGRIILMDWDFDTLTVHHSEMGLTRKIIYWRADNYGSNSWSGRQLYSRLMRANLHSLAVHPVISIGLDNQSALFDALLRAAAAAQAGGGITASEHDSWTAELHQKAAAGLFFASINYFIVSGKI